ncbi:MAG: bifunctional hydroxymethylpyrimidine kinase/phosphomethylpyrimidine kinase [bacterium]|nr:bifunctional hydroxymethylpyrimidine kinase/phosphomethylpyrimidine kinase [bacterium]
MFRALTIAGSDSGGGAGIQADLKTFCSLHVYGATVLTAVTAQNTQSVSSVLGLPPSLVAAQLDAVLSDIGADACKTGMLFNAEIVTTVAERLRAHNVTRLVVDPVMIAKSGARLLDENAVHSLVDLLFPLATIITPNVPEAEALTGLRISCEDHMIQAAARLLKAGPQWVVIKGGHLEGDATDLVYTTDTHHFLRSPRIMTRCTHGTGCTFSAAITAYLARGLDPLDAIKCAKTYITQAIITATDLGNGFSPVNHFWNVPPSFRSPAPDRVA